MLITCKYNQILPDNLINEDMDIWEAILGNLRSIETEKVQKSHFQESLHIMLIEGEVHNSDGEHITILNQVRLKPGSQVGHQLWIRIDMLVCLYILGNDHETEQTELKEFFVTLETKGVLDEFDDMG